MVYDLAIIGGGPAGAGAGVYASRKRLRTILITKDWMGQSSVSEKIENWVGTVAISGTDLAKSLENHVKAYASGILDFAEGHSCTNISEDTKNKTFNITTDKGSFTAKTILITAGSRRRKLDIVGANKFEHKGLTYCATCDGPLYSDQDVIVVGGGNAGFESASQLLAYCKSVTLINRSNVFKADPGTVEKVLSHPKMRAIKNATPKEIKGDKFVSSFVYTDAVSGKDVEINATGIFAEIGSIPNTDFAKNVVKIDEWGRVITDPRNQRASSSGIWSAGDCTDGLFHQNNIAVGDAVKAIEDIYLFLNA